MIKYIPIFFCLFFLKSVHAQNEKIETDRPGQTITPSTTPNKWIQSDFGFEKKVDKPYPLTKVKYLQYPSLLIKYGLGNRLELRLISEFTSKNYESTNFKNIETGTDNSQIGIKFNFLNEKGFIPKTSIVAHYRINSLNTNLNGKDTTNGGNIRLAMQNKITDNFLIGYNIGLEKRSWNYKPMYFYTFSPKFSFEENWQAFIEIYGFVWKGRLPQTTVDAGISYFVNDNFKIDISAGLRINKNVNNKFYGLGASYRFKTVKDN